jgi:hypothetical protein
VLWVVFLFELRGGGVLFSLEEVGPQKRDAVSKIMKKWVKWQYWGDKNNIHFFKGYSLTFPELMFNAFVLK